MHDIRPPDFGNQLDLPKNRGALAAPLQLLPEGAAEGEAAGDFQGDRRNNGANGRERERGVR